MVAYRLGVGLAVAVLFAAQRSLTVFAEGRTRVVLGYGCSLLLMAGLAEFATLAAGRRLAGRGGGDRVPTLAVFAIASALLAANAASKPLAGVLALLPASPPTGPLLALVAGWLAVLVWVRRRRGCGRATLALAMVGLVVGTRVLVLGNWPFDRLDGDMLPTIDRALDALAAGRFPYIDFPPPMPYLPGTFLAYAPAKWLGLDLRVTNLALEGAAVLTAVLLAPRAGPSASRTAGVDLAQILLPLLMLHPVWAHLGANTQYAPSVLAAVLLATSVRSGRPGWQAVALGVAVGTNQMLGACGPALLASWLVRLGPKKAAGLALLTSAVFGAMIAPFAAWDPGRFVAIAFLHRGAFSPEQMAGRFSLLPAAAGVVPHASAALTAASVLVAAALAAKARRPEGVAASMALGLAAALLFQPVSFPHYLLPVFAMVALAPVPASADAGPPADGPRRRGHRPRAPHAPRAERPTPDGASTAGP